MDCGTSGMSPPFNLCGLGCACFLQHKTLSVGQEDSSLSHKTLHATSLSPGSQLPIMGESSPQGTRRWAGPLSKLLGLDQSYWQVAGIGAPDLPAMLKKLQDSYLGEGAGALQVLSLPPGSVHPRGWASVKAFVPEREAEWRSRRLVGKMLPRGLWPVGQCWSQAWVRLGDAHWHN